MMVCNAAGTEGVLGSLGQADEIRLSCALYLSDMLKSARPCQKGYQPFEAKTLHRLGDAFAKTDIRLRNGGAKCDTGLMKKALKEFYSAVVVNVRQRYSGYHELISLYQGELNDIIELPSEQPFDLTEWSDRMFTLAQVQQSMRPEKMTPSDGAENPKVFKFEDSVDGDEKKPEQCTYKSWCVSAIIREMSQNGDATIEPSLLTKANKQCPKECHPEPDSDISEAKGFSLGIRASERSRVSINAKLVAATHGG